MLIRLQVNGALSDGSGDGKVPGTGSCHSSAREPRATPKIHAYSLVWGLAEQLIQGVRCRLCHATERHIPAICRDIIAPVVARTQVAHPMGRLRKKQAVELAMLRGKQRGAW